MNRTAVNLAWAVALILSAGVATAAKPKAAAAVLPPLAPIEAARQILADADAVDVERRIEALGRRIAVEPDSAEVVLAALERDATVPAATLRAELLLWLARGNDVRDGSHEGEMPTDRLGQQAGPLLDHPDPFVRGIAEWALAARLGAEYESAEENVRGARVAKPWPAADEPAWYRRWEAIGAEEALELDYVRQAAALGTHRTTRGLMKSADVLVGQAEGLLDYIGGRGTAELAGAARASMERVRAAHVQLRNAAAASPDDLTAQRKLFLVLRRAVREMAMANPDVDFRQVVFGVRQAAKTGGNITVGRWNTHTPGGDLYVKSGLAPADSVRPLLDARLGPGHLRGMELSWDADKLVFAYARQAGRAVASLRPRSDLGGYFGQGTGAVEEMSRLFEVRIDGSGLRQLTDAAYHADQEPTFLPNGDIVFVSDRSNFGSQCAGALEQDNMILNLYRCDPDGRNLRPLSNNKDFDRHPHVMDTGQLLFLHWEYQERHLWQTHTLWTCRPDGSMTDALYKQHVESGPMSLREARQIPGQRKVAAIACGHHNFDQGALFVADYGRGVNQRDAMRNVTPGVSGTEGGYGGVKPVAEGGVCDRGGHYMFPYPLSEKSFLAAYSYKRPERLAGQNYALYYLDVWGNKELIHRDKRMSVAYLAPLRPRPRPPVLHELPPDADPAGRYAVASVANVRAGWPDTTAGTVKYLRICQKVPWPCVPDESKACGFNDLHWMPAAWEPVLGMWDWGHARVIGIVPVEPDGSAHFKVPADQTVYFQALDENFLELRRMRSNVTFRSGETRTCVGCHESKAVAPPSLRETVPLALRRSPSTPEPPPWGDRVLPDYERHIQPILDRHCVRCHGQENPKGGLELTSRRIDGYMQSYRALFGLKPADPTPFAAGWWRIWRPGQPPLSDEANQYAKTFLRNVLRNPPTGQLVSVADYTGGPEVTQPLQFGSRRSKLILTLRTDAKHRQEVHLARDEWLSLVTWVDLNAQYWGTFVEKDGHLASRRPGSKAGQVVPPRRVQVLFPDPWRRPPAGQWFWQDADTVALKTDTP